MISRFHYRRASALLGMLFTLASLPTCSHAAAAGGGLEWETPLQTFSNSLTGPVAFTLSLSGIVVGGAMLIWGGEINEWARRMIMLVLVISVIVLAKNILSTLFGVGALIS